MLCEKTLPRNLSTVLKQPASTQAFLSFGAQRDITRTRRVILLQILRNERYLTRAQLIVRTEYRLGRNCFGMSAWEDTFYRDVRVVKLAFQAVGYVLEYSRDRKNKGYYLKGQPALSPEFSQMVKASVEEVDQRQKHPGEHVVFLNGFIAQTQTMGKFGNFSRTDHIR